MLCALLLKCATFTSLSATSFFDQLGSQVVLPATPRRIVSLVPSQTELLCDLGLYQEIVGVTRFCGHPFSLQKEKQIVGGTKNFKLDVIEKLSPDIIIGNKEENDKNLIGKLKEKFPVWMSDIVGLSDARNMIASLGMLTGKINEAEAVISKINASFSTLKPKLPRRVLYLIWKDPWMAAGSKTFIHAMLELLGLVNCVEHKERYPQLSDDDIRNLNPELILLSSEPYPFKEKHMNELKKISLNAKTVLVDGEMFSWYGSRLIKAAEYFNQLSL